MRSWKIATSLGLVFAFAVAACGGGGPQGPGNDPGSTPPETVRQIIVNQDSEPQSYALEGGRYRVAWSSTLANCPDGIVISINKVDVLPGQPHPSPFEYEKATDIPAFNTLLSRVPPGLYTFEQTQASCATWELRSDRVGN